MEINKQLQESNEVLQVPTMPRRAIFGVSPIHPRVMVGHSCWCLHSPWFLLQQQHDGSWWWTCSVVESLMLTWEVQCYKSSCTTSHGCEVFRGIAEVHHWWHTRPADLINTSQATKYLVLGDCKSTSPGRNKVSFLTEQLVSTKGKIFVNILLPLQLERFEDVLLKFATYCVAKHQVYLGTSSNR
jgi:hypothetical protein